MYVNFRLAYLPLTLAHSCFYCEIFENQVSLHFRSMSASIRCPLLFVKCTYFAAFARWREAPAVCCVYTLPLQYPLYCNQSSYRRMTLNADRRGAFRIFPRNVARERKRFPVSFHVCYKREIFIYFPGLGSAFPSPSFRRLWNSSSNAYVSGLLRQLWECVNFWKD